MNAVVEVKNLTKCYGKTTVVDNISFSADSGEILGFLGPNGAGKSTTMNIITGYISSTSGTVTVDGYDILSNPRKVKSLIGYLPEIPPLYVDMTVRKYLEFMFDLKRVRLPKKEHIEEVMRLIKIDHVSERLIKHLSKGYRQRVGFAQALLGNPPVLIFDEPTVGLDPQQIIERHSARRAEGYSSRKENPQKSRYKGRRFALCRRIRPRRRYPPRRFPRAYRERTCDPRYEERRRNPRGQLPQARFSGSDKGGLKNGNDYKT